MKTTTLDNLPVEFDLDECRAFWTRLLKRKVSAEEAVDLERTFNGEQEASEEPGDKQPPVQSSSRL